jgi:peptide/nickel transport system substrate-binding protein
MANARKEPQVQTATRKTLFACVAAIALLSGFTAAAQPIDRSKTILWGDNLPGGLDPHAIYDRPMQFILLNVYDGLYRYVGNEVRPWLAESHTVGPDGLTWTFKLRRGVKFHDGSDVTADDVVYSFKRLLAMGKGPAGAFRPVLRDQNISAVDHVTVRFVLDKPYAPFLAAVPLVAIVNSRLLKANEVAGDWGAKWLASNEAGSGAYRFDPATYRSQEVADLYRFAQHFMGWSDNPKPIERVHITSFRETSSRVLALIKGDVDTTDAYLPVDQVERVEDTPGLRVMRDESLRVMVIRMNNSRPPFNNLNFRKCLSHAFNYDGFIVGMLNKFAVRNAGPIPKNLWGAPADLAGYGYDLDKAREYCNKAKAEGAPVNRKITFKTLAGFDQTAQAAQLLQADLRKLGIEMQIQADTWPNVSTSATKLDTSPDLFAHWISAYFIDPENWIGEMYDSERHGTWKAGSWYKNPKVDELLRAARAETQQAKRKSLYEEASRLVVADAADIWIYNTIQLRGLNERVSGYKFSPVGDGGEIRTLSLKK